MKMRVEDGSAPRWDAIPMAEASTAPGMNSELTELLVKPNCCSGEDRTSTGVYEIDPLRDSRWNDFVETHPKASVFHSRNWLSTLHDSYGYTPSVFSTSKPREPITDGVVFCRITSWLTGSRIVSLPFSDHCEPLVSTPEESDAILQRLRQEIERKHWNYAELRPISQQSSLTSGFTEYARYFWHSIDLSRTCEALFRSFDKDSAQRRIRRAERERLKYEVGNSEALLNEFFRLFLVTRRRHCIPPQPYSWFRHLSRSFGDKLQIRLISSGGRAIASSLTLKHGQTVTYKYGCSDPRFNRLGGMPLLFWRTIEEAKSEGFTQFDLGRSNVDNAGLVRFKENWGARRVILNYLKAGGSAHSQVRPFVRTLSRMAFPIAPEWFLVTAGRLLYRHIG